MRMCSMLLEEKLELPKLRHKGISPLLSCVPLFISPSFACPRVLNWGQGEPLLAHAALFYEGQRGAPAFVGTPPWHLSGVKPMPPLLEYEILMDLSDV